MAFAPVSPLTIDGLNKFLSIKHHPFINYATYTFAELGIADRLIHAASDRGFTIEEIIGDNRQQWNSQLLNQILRACVYGGIVELINDDQHFILTPSVLSGAILQLPNLVRGEGIGTGVARTSGGFDFYTLMSQPDQKEFSSIFSGAMKTISMQTGSSLVAGVDFGRFKTMFDLGGNSGRFLAEILENYPTIQHVIVLDLPHIINQQNIDEEFKSREIHKDRWSFVSGDMYNPSTFHQQMPIQANENKKSSPTTIFIIESIILPDEALSNWQSHGLDILMAALFDDARERTEDEHKNLLQKTGFEFKKLYPI